MDCSKQRVLLLFEYPSLNGGERSLIAAVDVLQDTSIEFVAAAPKQGPLAEALRTRGMAHAPFSVRCTRGKRKPQAAIRQDLAAIVSAFRPALVHANSLAMSRLAGPVLRDVGTPSVGHLRDIVRVSRQGVADINCNTRLLAVSDATRDWHVAQGMLAQKTHVLYNGVDLEVFRPGPANGCLHRELDVPKSCPLIGAIGQIGARKGQDIFCDAAARLAARRPDVHYVIIGERFSEKDEAVQFQRQLALAAGRPPLAGRFHFLGARTDVARLLNELTLLVHAARQEPLGRVLLEACAAGVAVVATCVGGAEEIFPNDTSAACLVPPEAPVALSEAMDKLLTDDALRRQLGAAARQRAEAAFGIQRSAERLAKHYFATLS